MPAAFAYSGKEGDAMNLALNRFGCFFSVEGRRGGLFSHGEVLSDGAGRLNRQLTPTRRSGDSSMPHIVNIRDAKARLSHLIAQAEEGQDVILARNGVPVARIVPIARPIARVIELIKRERPEGPLVSAGDIRTAREQGRA